VSATIGSVRKTLRNFGYTEDELSVFAHPRVLWPLRFGAHPEPGIRPAEEMVLPPIGYHFAGLVDGEAHFAIARGPKGTYSCSFVLKMRADDRPFLELMRGLLGEPGALTMQMRGEGTNQNPTVSWIINRKNETVWLTEVLDVYQPLSKKRRDYAIWREAVIACAAGAQNEMAEHFEAIRAVRAYREDV
jgi:hypothetical protein